MANKYTLTKAVVEPEPELTVYDYTEMFVKFSEKYRNVFMVQIKDEVFIYRAIGRAEYREITESRKFSELKKEELICSQCLLYPDPDTYEWDDKEAGIPTELMKSILKDSYLDSVDHRRLLHEYYRAEMYDLDNQITCIINEAFPNIDIEEIEAWDIEKTTKYLSRAEWKLHNLHGLQFKEAKGEYQNEHARNNDEKMGRQQGEPQKAVEEKKKDGKTIRGGDRKNKLTPEKLREREEFLKKFPEFAQGTIDDLNNMDQQETVDTTPPALRVGW